MEVNDFKCDSCEKIFESIRDLRRYLQNYTVIPRLTRFSIARIPITRIFEFTKKYLHSTFYIVGLTYSSVLCKTFWNIFYANILHFLIKINSKE